MLFFFFDAGLNSYSLSQLLWVFGLNIIYSKSFPRKVKCKMISGHYSSRNYNKLRRVMLTWPSGLFFVFNERVQAGMWGGKNDTVI